MLTAAFFFGCAAQSPRAAGFLEADPVARAALVRKLATSGSPEGLKGLIDLLDDPDVVVRWEAIRALKRLEGRDFGYGPAAERGARLDAMERWKEYLRERRLGLETKPAQTPGESHVGR